MGCVLHREVGVQRGFVGRVRAGDMANRPMRQMTVNAATAVARRRRPARALLLAVPKIATAQYRASVAAMIARTCWARSAVFGSPAAVSSRAPIAVRSRVPIAARSTIVSQTARLIGARAARGTA